MLISPFTPLFFNNRKTDGLDSPYVQIFAPTDQILIQIIIDTDEEDGDWVLYSEPDHSVFSVIEPNVWHMNDSTDVRFAVVSPSPGLYSIEVASKTSEVFRVTDDSMELDKTTLIQYSMNDNRQRADGVFIIDGMQRFFDFRVPGGFKESNYAFSVEGEQFVTPSSDIVQLYGLDSVQRKFTLGNSEGCPIWFAELLNRLLCCTYVYFDGERYARKDTSVPEMNVQLEGVNSFVFTQNLQKVKTLNPMLEHTNQAIIRRIEENFRLISTNSNRLI